MSNVDDCAVAHVVIFCPKPEENVYLQWFKNDPADGAKGSVFQFLSVITPDEEVYTQADDKVAKFDFDSSDIPLTDALSSLSDVASSRLGISVDLAAEIMQFVDALLSDEAEDLDEGRFDYRWVDAPNDFVGFNKELGAPENRVHIKVRSSQFSGQVSAKIDGKLAFDSDGLGLAFAISHFEQTE